jgi:GNAT superfamily N-acetyltransferase
MSCGGHADGSANLNAAAVREAVSVAAAAGEKVTVAQTRRLFHGLADEFRFRADQDDYRDAPLVNDEAVAPLYERIRATYPLDKFGLAIHQRHDGSRWLQVSMISVEPSERGKGVGAAAMADLCAVADEYGWQMSLTPDASMGSSKARLTDWYKSMGFRSNAGRSRDYSMTDTMVREPVPKVGSGERTQAAHAAARRFLVSAAVAEGRAQRFVAEDEDARWWSSATRAAMDLDGVSGPERPACEQMSDRFASWLGDQGVTATVVHGENAAYRHDPLVGHHRWVEVDGVCYDFTVRQFHNVAGPVGAFALKCRVPLTWPAGQPHPLLAFRDVTAVGHDVRG